MDARHLETFHAVVRCGSLLAASRDLRCAQSTITVRIQELEQELGAPLFTRHGRKSVLTEAGQAVFERSAQIADSIAALKEIAARYSGGAAGRVRLGAIEPTVSHRLPPIITAFYRARPNLQLIIEAGGAERLQKLVAEGELDFSISSPPTLASVLQFEKLFDEPIGLLIPKRHPLAKRRRIEPEDLQQFVVVLTDRGCAYRRTIESALRGITLPTVIQAANPNVMRGLVTAGLGVGIMPMKGAGAPNTVLRHVHGVPLALPVGFVSRPDHVLTPVQRELRERLRAALTR
jgi:LysR family transcriptional regulator, regulator of the ytmI operon